MKIVIPDIPEEGLNLEIDEKLSLEEVSLVSPVKAGLSVQKAAKEVIVTGNLTVEAEYACSRCLKEFRQSLEVPVSVVYHPADEIGNERHQLHGDEMDLSFYSGEAIDVDELLREQILLNVQMQPLCSEQCRGICPKCGTDLNAGTCGCSAKEIDPRLEVLKKLLDKGKE